MIYNFAFINRYMMIGVLGDQLRMHRQKGFGFSVNGVRVQLVQIELHGHFYALNY
jgi:hypothetical protein